ncbi:hypothetical protein D3C84_676720 [compost metagenome]
MRMQALEMRQGKAVGVGQVVDGFTVAGKGSVLVGVRALDPIGATALVAPDHSQVVQGAQQGVVGLHLIQLLTAWLAAFQSLPKHQQVRRDRRDLGGIAKQQVGLARVRVDTRGQYVLYRVATAGGAAQFQAAVSRLLSDQGLRQPVQQFRPAFAT